MDQREAFDWMMRETGTPPEDIEANAEMIAEANRIALEHANMIKRALVDNDAGALLLDFLTQATIMTPLMQVSGSLVQGEVALSPADWAYVRAGQNSVVHMLLDQIKFAMTPNQGVDQNG